MAEIPPEDVLLVAKLGDALDAWIRFKEWHDLKSAKLECCEISKGFFEAMDSLETQLKRLINKRIEKGGRRDS